MIKKILFLLLCFFVADVALSQEYFVVALTENVSMQNMKLKKGYRYDLSPKSNLELAKEARAIVYNKSKYLELGNDLRVESYKPEQWRSRLEKVQPATNIIAYIGKMYRIRKLEEQSNNSGHAGVRALNKKVMSRISSNGDEIFPMDSAKILGNSVRLKWTLEKKLMKAKLIITNKNSGAKVLEKDVPNSGEFEFVFPSQGTFEWKLFSTFENIGSEPALFIKPDATENASLLEDIEIFRELTKDLSRETAAQLLDDYLFYNKIIEP
ncbi:MAG: hypothetical protein EOO50_15825 [Flavobacterium sp.]|uniref:hypothetical protein n=1 Tax=Flavobacterium sp. TaxID=239 RepID=UPI001210CAC3|nr:hypothetical protein [Flavobacterium sp.]RZJ64366.1 MAG: hypothetical protein EOO50_15825 [Flavobacterium sp.]